MQHRPYLVAALGQAPMIVMHLRQVAVAPFDRRRGTLKDLGLTGRPRLPPLKHIGGQLPGDRVPVKRVLNGLQRLEQSGLPSRATRARYLLLPIHQRQKHFFNPSRPHWRQGHLLHILPYPLPPKVHQGCHFTHRFAKFGTIPLQMNPKNFHFQASKDQEWRSLPCVSKTLQRRSFCKTMLPVESAEGPRSQRKRPFYALCDTIYCKPMVPVLQTYG